MQLPMLPFATVSLENAFMLGKDQTTQLLQIRLASAVELARATLEPYWPWITNTIGVPLDETLTIEVDTNPGDGVGAHILQGIGVGSATAARTRSWHPFIENWSLPAGVSPRVVSCLQRERGSKGLPSSVWEIDWQECPVAFQLKGLGRRVVSVQVPLSFPPGDNYMAASSKHWFIVGKEDAAKLLVLIQQVQATSIPYFQTGYGRTPLATKYDWSTVVLDASARRMVQTDFELFFEREQWFRQHNLPYRRGYLFWGDPGNGKTAAIRIMAAHPQIRSFALDLGDMEERNKDIHHLFQMASENTPALIVLEDLDRAFPKQGKQQRERAITFQALLNCLDGVGTRDGVIVVATANDPTCLDAAILKRPGRFYRVVWFRNPEAELRREYYQHLNPMLSGEEFEPAIQKTKGFSFAQLRESYILGAQSALEDSREIVVTDVIEAIETMTAGTQELKASQRESGFVMSGPKIQSLRGTVDRNVTSLSLCEF